MAVAKLTDKAKARIRIAKEALAALGSKKIIASCNTWLADKNGNDVFTESDIDGKKDLKSVLKEATKCEACAIGGLFAAAVMLFNKMPCSKLELETTFEGQYGWLFIKKYLKQFFDLDQMALIEYTFEGGQGLVNLRSRSDLYDGQLSSAELSLLSKEDQEKGLQFYDYYADAGERMVAILMNIVRNKGDFIIQTVVQ